MSSTVKHILLPIIPENEQIEKEIELEASLNTRVNVPREAAIDSVTFEEVQLTGSPVSKTPVEEQEEKRPRRLFSVYHALVPYYTVVPVFSQQEEEKKETITKEQIQRYLKQAQALELKQTEQ